MDGFIQFIVRCYDAIFGNVGKKLQILAKAYLGISILAAIVGFIVTAAESLDSLYSEISLGFYFVSAIVFVLVSFFASWLVYAFGQIVDDIHHTRLAASEDKAVAFDHLPKL